MEIKPEDMARYRAIIAKLELTQPHIDESILILRAIMQSFVDRAFGAGPVFQPVRAGFAAGHCAARR